MSMKHVVGYLFGIAASAVAAGAAYYFGMKEGQRQVVDTVNDIREQCKYNDELDLDDALEAQLTNDKGEYEMRPCDKTDMIDGMTFAACAGLATAGVTSMVMASGVSSNCEQKITDMKVAFHDYFDQAIDKSLHSYNTVIDQAQRIGSATDVLPEGAEKEALKAYYGGLMYGKYAMETGVEGWMMKEGWVRPAEPGDKIDY